MTAQAVSKWENESGMPDISQIIPLASTFGVSTDVLFGIAGYTENKEVLKVFDEVGKDKSADYSPDKRKFIAKQNYDKLQEALKVYPDNHMLLMNSLELAMALSYSENNDTYFPECANDIYNKAIRQANIMITYGRNTTDILRAHMIMVLLHCNRVNINMAWEHADQFPWRADLTIHEMSAYIAHSQQDYKSEAVHCQRDIMYHLEAMLDNITQLGCCYLQLEKYDDALKMFQSVFSLIETFFDGEELLPPLHCRERGDVHTLIAQTYLNMNDTENAFLWIKKMVDYDLNIRSKFENDMLVKTPFLRDVGFTFYWTHYDAKRKSLEKLNSSIFDGIRNCDRFHDSLKHYQL